jgi:hypothetical protein
MRVAARAAFLVGGGKLFGRDHHGQLQHQRYQRQDAGHMARDQGDGNTQDREGKGEVVAAERVQDIDTAGEHRIRSFSL